MNLEKAKALAESYRLHWSQWITNSIWKDDPFLIERVPVAMVAKYGQNIPIGVPDRLQQEQNAFLEHRVWEHLRFVTFAIASNVRCVLANVFPLCCLTNEWNLFFPTNNE